MGRKRVQAEPVLGNWSEVDAALAEIRRLEDEQAAHTATLEEELQDLRGQYEPDMATRKARIVRLEKDIEEFCQANKQDLEQSERKRSKTLPNGIVGFRRATELATTNRVTWGDVVQRLQEAGRKWVKLLRVKATVNKEAVRDADLPAETMERFGMRWREKDSFSYEVSREALAETVPIDGQAKRAAG